MSRSCRIVAALAGIALLLPVAAWAQDPPPSEPAPQPPPPAETTPDPDPVVVVEPEPPVTVTIKVPPLPEKKAAPKRAAPQPAKPVRKAPVRRSEPRRSAPVVETPYVAPEPEASDPEPQAAPKPTRKPKPKAKPPKRQPRPRVVATAPETPLKRVIRDPEPSGAVLAARFSLERGSDGGGGGDVLVLVLALGFAGMLAAVVAVAGSAPLLADRWPKVFVPVIEATDRIVVAGICLAGAALTLAITWALTGPGP